MLNSRLGASIGCGKRIPAVPAAKCTVVCKAQPYSRHVESMQPEPLKHSERWMGQGIAASVALALLVSSPCAQATGLESVDLLSGLESIQTPEGFKAGANKELLQAADETFQSSDTLKRLLENSDLNRAKNKKAIADKYCYRQAELGVGDCGGLRFIPGLTENGKQRTPDWLSDLLGVERAAPEDKDAMTMKKLFGGEIPK